MCVTFFLPLVKPLSDCHKCWQLCPEAVCAGTQIGSGLCVLACCLGLSIHWPMPCLLSPRPLRRWQGSTVPHSRLCMSLIQMWPLAACQLKSCLELEGPTVTMGQECAQANTAKTNGSSYATDITLLSLRCIGWDNIEPWQQQKNPAQIC